MKALRVKEKPECSTIQVVVKVHECLIGEEMIS